MWKTKKRRNPIPANWCRPRPVKYLPIDPSLFVEHRKHLKARLKPNSISVFLSNDVMPTSADGRLAFVQHSDLFYLCGIDQEDDPGDMSGRSGGKAPEILFVRETSEQIRIWEGPKYTPTGKPQYQVFKPCTGSGSLTVCSGHWCSSPKRFI